MAVLEAMACSLPAVATDVSGVSNLVGAAGSGCTALVVAPAADWSRGLVATRAGAVDGDPIGALADAMDRLAADAELRRRLGRAGRRRVEEAFTLDRIAERLEGHYGSLLHGGAVRRAARPALG
jgi:glycosyltransferase involved in cell wall biosynthesis